MVVVVVVATAPDVAAAAPRAGALMPGAMPVAVAVPAPVEEPSAFSDPSAVGIECTDCSGDFRDGGIGFAGTDDVPDADCVVGSAADEHVALDGPCQRPDPALAVTAHALEQAS